MGVTQQIPAGLALHAHRINGAEDTSARGTVPVFNPATGAHIAETALAPQATITRAVDAAAQALPGWSALPAIQRARVLFRFRELLEAHREKLEILISTEHGKILSDARGEVQRAIETVEFAATAPGALRGTHLDNVGGSIDNWSMRQPVGVCVGITPFNFP